MVLKILKKYWPITFIFFLTALFFGRTLIPSEGKIIYGGDLNDQFFYWKSFLAESIRSGTIPFWNPYSFSGMPFLAHPSTAVFYPLTLIFFLFPISTAFSVYLFFHVFLACTFMFFLLRKYADDLSSLISAVVFGFSGLMAARIYSGHIDIISTLVWLPAVFGSIDAAINKPGRKNIALAILFFTLQILAGYQAVVVFTLELIFIYQAVLAFIAGKNRLIKLKTFITIIIISFGLSAVQILPTLEFVRNSIRGNGLPYDLLTWGSYTWDQFLMFINPFHWGNPFPESYTYHGPGPNFFELSYFAGVLPLLLFIFYSGYNLYKFYKAKKFDKAFLSISVPLIFFILMSLGNNFPLHKILYVLFPPYRLFRFPPQHLMMAVFIIAFVSGLALKRVNNKLIQAVILLLIIGELFIYDAKFIRLSEMPTAFFDHNLVSILGQNRDLARLLPDYSVVSMVRKSWDFESAPYYKIFSTSGYNPIFPGNYYNFIDRINGRYSSSIKQYNVEIPPPDPFAGEIDFLNIKYILADKNHDNIYTKPSEKFVFITEGENFRLYENKNFRPRFFLDCDSNKKVQVINYNLNNIRLGIDSGCSGNLISSEIYYPGWQAKIDGKIVPVSKYNAAFRSIALQKGAHNVEFYYQPTVYLIGLIITLISLAAGTVVIKKYS